MFRKISITLLALSLLLAACAPKPAPTPAPTEPIVTEAPTLEATPTEEPAFPITLTDGLGRTVEFTEPARRIVSLTPAGTEILFAVGVTARIVANDMGTDTTAQLIGRDMFSDYPPEALSVMDIGGSWGEYNSEAIVSLQPDLVLAGGINPPELVASLENLGLKVFFLPNPLLLEDLYTNLQVVGQITAHPLETADLVASLQARVAEVDRLLAGVADKPSVYYELDATPFTAGPGTFVDQLISRAGGSNFGASMESAWAQISLEQLLLADPFMIILGDAAYGESAETVAARPGWDALTAVKESRIFAFDDNLVSRPGPRLVDGLEQLARLIHPELFK